MKQPANTCSAILALQAAFLSILPRILLHARITFRYLVCPHQREDAAAEMVALCWLWSIRLNQRGKDARQFPAVLASYAARSVKSGRRLCGQESAHDVLSSTAQQRRRFHVASLVDDGLNGTVLENALVDNRQTPPPEQAAFRIDFPDWLRSHQQRDRRVIEDLMAGEPARDIAQKHGLTSARVSQLRRRFKKSWERMGEAA